MPAPYRRIMPGDWVRLERLINEIFGILNSETTLSDVVLNASDLQVEVNAVSDVAVANTSDIVILKSDIAGNDSDIVVLKSDVQVNTSDIAVVAAGAGSVSDVTTNTSDIVVLKSDIIVNTSDVAVLAAEPDCPVYKYIKALAQAPGDLHLSDGTNWNISKALIKYIGVDTVSTDWDLWLVQNDNGHAADDATIPALKIINNCNGEANIQLDYPYEDEDASAEVHLYYVDNAGANTADIYIKAYELA